MITARGTGRDNVIHWQGVELPDKAPAQIFSRVELPGAFPQQAAAPLLVRNYHFNLQLLADFYQGQAGLGKSASTPQPTKKPMVCLPRPVTRLGAKREKGSGATWGSFRPDPSGRAISGTIGHWTRRPWPEDGPGEGQRHVLSARFYRCVNSGKPGPEPDSSVAPGGRAVEPVRLLPGGE